MSDVIVVRGIRADGRHGLQATGERETAQEIVVDIELVLAAVASDDLRSTVDYDEIVRLVRSIISGESYELVETIANVIATRVLDLGGTSVTVSVRKPSAERALKVDQVAVTVDRP